eukprot:175011-Chlamydomonas_euryale.AAC.4
MDQALAVLRIALLAASARARNCGNAPTRDVSKKPMPRYPMYTAPAATRCFGSIGLGSVSFGSVSFGGVSEGGVSLWAPVWGASFGERQFGSVSAHPRRVHASGLLGKMAPCHRGQN